MSERWWKVLQGNNKETIRTLEDESIQTVVTSPPYFGLRSYGGNEMSADEMGNEETPEEFCDSLCDLFDIIKPKLKENGTMWVNLGDTYAQNVSEGIKKFGNPESFGRKTIEYAQPKRKITGDLKQKDLIGIPWMFAFEMRKRGWYLRQDIIWQKNNPTPESVKDRCTKSHEYIFLFSKSPHYYFDYDSIREECISKTDGQRIGRKENIPGYGRQDTGNKWIGDGKRNKRSVWEVPVAASQTIGIEHFAVYPEELILPCILAGAGPGDVVFDPFNGSGTTGVVALKNDRNYIGCELYDKFKPIYEKRLNEAKQKNSQDLLSEANAELFDF